MKTGLVVILLLLIFALLKAIEGLEAELSIIEWELDKCETGAAVYREALEETIDPKGKGYWIEHYNRWESVRFPKFEQAKK